MFKIIAIAALITSTTFAYAKAEQLQEFPLIQKFKPNDQYRVIDGDTFEYNGNKYRLSAIDTAEIKGKCPKEIMLAKAAKEYLEMRLSPDFGKQIKLYGNKQDKYGRRLVEVIVDGSSVNTELMQQNLARPYSGGKRQSWCEQ
jgi:micrococcal nuclease